jgi:molybdopterin molybdotransferase
LLHVLTIDEADALLAARFSARTAAEWVSLQKSLGRTLCEELRAGENLPGFMRATVDGYAIRAADSFGCSESMPALLKLMGRVPMGALTELALPPGGCAYVPTGGALPEGADAMVMLEHAEPFGAYIAVQKPIAPGQQVVRPGEDAGQGQLVLPAGRVLSARGIAALAALGVERVKVAKRPRVAILSTGDEIVPVENTPTPGQMRDVNGPMLCAQAAAFGAAADYLGIVPDEEEALAAALRAAAEGYALVLVSGGSSAGEKDAVARVIGRLGALLFHGLAAKPGKPTLAGEIGGVPVVGLPGHPLAAHMVCHVLLRPMIGRMLGTARNERAILARLSCNLPANDGREALVPVRLNGGRIEPLNFKSGLITGLQESDGYIRVPRDCEGLNCDEELPVYLWENE